MNAGHSLVHQSHLGKDGGRIIWILYFYTRFIVILIIFIEIIAIIVIFINFIIVICMMKGIGLGVVKIGLRVVKSKVGMKEKSVFGENRLFFVFEFGGNEHGFVRIKMFVGKRVVVVVERRRREKRKQIRMLTSNVHIKVFVFQQKFERRRRHRIDLFLLLSPLSQLFFHISSLFPFLFSFLIFLHFISVGVIIFIIIRINVIIFIRIKNVVILVIVGIDIVILVIVVRVVKKERRGEGRKGEERKVVEGEEKRREEEKKEMERMEIRERIFFFH